MLKIRSSEEYGNQNDSRKRNVTIVSTQMQIKPSENGCKLVIRSRSPLAKFQASVLFSLEFCLILTLPCCHVVRFYPQSVGKDVLPTKIHTRKEFHKHNSLFISPSTNEFTTPYSKNASDGKLIPLKSLSHFLGQNCSFNQHLDCMITSTTPNISFGKVNFYMIS